MKTIRSAAAVLAILSVAEPMSHAEPATGFMVQGQISSNFMVGGLYYGQSFAVMPRCGSAGRCDGSRSPRS